ncbi:MAG TPA: bifunctional UDP-N-acetylglucosamine diphosphorylase/glucosamine-1-phosphate N-acetyltransferase GlmU [Vicinamibacterales bacterium]|nr:bifunctional UDP-N-acetylglucosamine diphosphorylase/glucosamine-1-phosphate N-acetyltransferase GlmU [Vicinamibacterales bacterium]
MPDLHVVILAAGKGTRMKSAQPKVLHRVAGRQMIDYVIRDAKSLSPTSITVVAGHLKERLRQGLQDHPELSFVTQEPQLGTGHALLQTAGVLEGRSGVVLLLSGDVPLLKGHTLAELLRKHEESGAAATVLTALVDQAYGYGRIVRVKGKVSRIVEERDASPAQRKIREINGGVYVFSLPPLFNALRGLATGNAQGEYYLTDLISGYRRRRFGVEAVLLDDPNEIRGINSRSELAGASRIVRQKKNEELMAAGVTIEDPATTYIDADVVVGSDTVIHPGVHLEGKTQIGQACEIHAGVRIVNSVLDDRVTVQNFCVISGSRVGPGATIGPFVHIRPETELRESVHIGNFVELKKSVVGKGSKAGHLSYLGDAVIGEGVNVGAGTITCNYDGTQKHQTTIEDGVFVGSDSQLVAPVTIGKGAYIGSGTTVRESVPAGSLAVSAGKQRNIAEWASKKKGESKK